MQQTNVYHVMKINFWIKIINAAIVTATVHNVFLDMIANLVKI